MLKYTFYFDLAINVYSYFSKWCIKTKCFLNVCTIYCNGLVVLIKFLFTRLIITSNKPNHGVNLHTRLRRKMLAAAHRSYGYTYSDIRLIGASGAFEVVENILVKEKIGLSANASVSEYI